MRVARRDRGFASKALFTGGTVLLCTWFYGQRKPQTNTETSPKPILSTNVEELTKRKAVAEEKPTVSHGTIKDAIKRLIEKNEGGLFPKGTQLQGTNLKEGVATLDFNAAFQEIQDSGESSESEMQRLFRKTLAEFSSVQKMRVTVDGQGFVSQSTDWGKPFPVRDTGASR